MSLNFMRGYEIYAMLVLWRFSLHIQKNYCCPLDKMTAFAQVFGGNKINKRAESLIRDSALNFLILKKFYRTIILIKIIGHLSPLTAEYFKGN